MEKIVFCLDQSDLMELQTILMDKDKDEALEFLTKRIAPQIPSKGDAPCDSSRKNPYLFKPE